MNKMISKIFSFIFVVNFLSASQVTLHVDMNGQTVSANGVHVAGTLETMTMTIHLKTQHIQTGIQQVLRLQMTIAMVFTASL